jgi:hypothetical protein
LKGPAQRAAARSRSDLRSLQFADLRHPRALLKTLSL